MRRDAETLALHLLHRDRAWMHAHPEATLTDAQASALRALLQRRAGGEPLQYITGHQEFFGLDLHVTRDVLIPRPETEHLVEAVLHWASTQSHGSLRLLDVGTGSGAIALALAAHLPEAFVTAVDISADALDVAGQNAGRLGLAQKVRFLESDLLDALAAELRGGQRFDAIASNPPYIPLADFPTLAPEVREHEPATALFAGADGLDIYRRLLPAAWEALRPGGLLAMEFGFGQSDGMERLFAMQPEGSWCGLRFTADLQGIPRVVQALKNAR